MKCVGQRLLCLGVGLLSLSLWSTAAVAQELTPRAYWPAPQGTKAIIFGYQYSAGDVVTDPSLPITGVDSKINFAQFAYLHTINFVGRTANLQFILPYSWGTTDVDEVLRADLQRNARIGATVMFPFKLQHAIRGSFSAGAVTRSGGDFATVAASYLYVWG